MNENEPVSAAIRQVGAQVRAEHHTIGVVRTLPGAVNELDCACGVVLTNGPGWSLDEHLRMHRAEVKYAALLSIAHPDMPLSRNSASPASPAVGALDAILSGDERGAMTVLARLRPGQRAALGLAALELARIAGIDPSDQSDEDVPGSTPSDDVLVEWTPGFPTLGRFGKPDSEEKVRDMVKTWNDKVSEGRESFPAAVYRRTDGGDWVLVE